MKTLTIDFYHKYGKTVRKSISFPDNAAFCKVHWTVFGKILDRIAGTKDEYDDETDYCYDVYCYIPDCKHDQYVNAQIEELCNYLSIDTLEFGNGMLLRIGQCDIVDYQDFISLDKLNDMIDFTNAYYMYTQKINMPNKFLMEFTELCNKPNADFTELDRKIKEYKKNADQTIAYCKIIKVAEEGLYTKVVHVKSWLDDNKAYDTIEHNVIEMNKFGYNEFEKLYYLYLGADGKERLEKRIQEIINI